MKTEKKRFKNWAKKELFKHFKKHGFTPGILTKTSSGKWDCIGMFGDHKIIIIGSSSLNHVEAIVFKQMAMILLGMSNAAVEPPF